MTRVSQEGVEMEGLKEVINQGLAGGQRGGHQCGPHSSAGPSPSPHLLSDL